MVVERPGLTFPGLGRKPSEFRVRIKPPDDRAESAKVGLGRVNSRFLVGVWANERSVDELAVRSSYSSTPKTGVVRQNCCGTNLQHLCCRRASSTLARFRDGVVEAGSDSNEDGIANFDSRNPVLHSRFPPFYPKSSPNVGDGHPYVALPGDTFSIARAHATTPARTR